MTLVKKGFWEEALLSAMGRRRFLEILPVTRELRLNEDSAAETVPDFAWPAARVAVYVDETYWHSGGEAMDRDRVKRNRLSLDGWCVLAFTDEQVRRGPDRCAKVVLEALKSALIDQLEAEDPCLRAWHEAVARRGHQAEMHLAHAAVEAFERIIKRVRTL